MNFSVGVDIVDARRLEKLINANRFFLGKILLPSEKSGGLLSIAGKVAAKEAILKTLDRGNFSDFMKFEIISEKGNIPVVKFGDLLTKKYGNSRFFLSISHDKDFSIAIALRVFLES